MVAVLAVFVAIFVAVQALDIPVLVDPSPALSEAGVAAAVAGVALLVADALLPVPSSVVMVAHGALFGVVVGTILSVVGRLGFSLVGFTIGRRSGPLLERMVRDGERARAHHLLQRWGALAVVISRPVPLLAETVVILAGASSMSLRRVIIATLAGVAPEALLYGMAGAVAGSYGSAALVFVALVAVALTFWFVEQAVRPSPPVSAGTPGDGDGGQREDDEG